MPSSTTSPLPPTNPQELAGSPWLSQPPPPRLLLTEVPVRSSLNGRAVWAEAPVVWESVVEHHPDVNFSITRFLLTLRHLYEMYTLWGKDQATCHEIVSAFNELIIQWRSVENSLIGCCNADLRYIRGDLNDIKTLCSATTNHDGPSSNLVEAGRPLFQKVVKGMINELREKRHQHGS
ncbi:hypothetical protein CTheo_1593 [Ceratobasidium theobromae]|uniref:Uncharacterized protein n=1 Tax=Ceratobasidium theobromae TaxID=1582974 RepID=A0A5N5QT97_9AGAM|nr:hypothetical protein CTheo_1593 [Ceratobasidium theobromae]